MINAGIVGFGSIGPIHAKAISNINGAAVYAICDIDREKADTGALEFNAKSYYDFDNMLLDSNIDVVHICTPHYLHCNMIKKALSHGKKVVTEKPVTMTEAEFDRIANTDICPMFQNRTNNSILCLKDIIERSSNEIGKLLAAKGVVMWHRDAAYYNSPWRGKLKTEGGGVLINQAIHTLDLLSYLCGDIKSVKATSSTKSLENVINTEDTIDALIEFSSGAKGMFFATNAYPINSSNIIELTFENTTYRYIDSSLYKLKNGTVQLVATDDTEALGKSYWGSGHKKVIEDYYKSLSDESVKRLTLDDIKNTMYTIFAMYESTKKCGKEVKICK